MDVPFLGWGMSARIEIISPTESIYPNGHPVLIVYVNYAGCVTVVVLGSDDVNAVEF